MNSNISKIIELPKIVDKRGNLTFIESLNHIPFEIKRSFWIYDVPGGETRGGHAYKKSEEFIVAISGSFDVVLDNGKQKQRHQLNRSYFGLYVPAGTWRYMDNFSTNSVALVLSSTFFDPSDYIRNYNDFLLFQGDDSLRFLGKSHINSIEKYSDFKRNRIKNCEYKNLSINHRDKGSITVIENNKNIDFDIKRVYYLYDIPGGEARGGHAHKELNQILVATSGSFQVILDDGFEKCSFMMSQPFQCLRIVPGIWREIVNFSSGSTCLVFASEHYQEKDYIRDYNEFVTLKNE